MRRLSFAAAFAASFLISASLCAATVVVDCSGATPGAFPTIMAALATLNQSTPNLVSVSGTCNENVVLRLDNVTIEGNPSATIHAATGTALLVRAAESTTLRRLTMSGPRAGLWVTVHSDVSLESVTLESSGTGLIADERAIVFAGGSTPARAVTIRNNNFGIIADQANFTANGNVSITNNNSPGIDAETSRLAFIGGATSPNVIDDNGSNGIFAHGGSNIDFRGTNSVSGNALTGILAYENSAVEVNGPTTLNGNARGGVTAIFNSTARIQGATVTNNGSLTEPLSSGVTAGSNGSAIITATTISGTNGPGVVVDSGAMARLNSTTITGSALEAVRLATGAIFEVQSGNSVTGDVTCEDSVVMFGTNAGDPAFKCKNPKK